MDFSQIVTSLASFSGGAVWGAVLAISAAGAITSVLLQAIKEILRWRRGFQRRFMERWMTARAKAYEAAAKGDPAAARGAEGGPAIDCLVEIITAGDRDAFFELEPSEIARRSAYAIPIVLDAPVRHRPLLLALAHGVDLAVIRLAAEPPAVSDAASDEANDEAAKALLDAHERVARKMKASLDGLEISMGRAWTRRMQVYSILATILVVEIAVLYNGGGGDTFLLGIVVGILGGAFAPVTRDIVAVVERLRKPT